jgi:uncharacterized membrane protein YhhN
VFNKHIVPTIAFFLILLFKLYAELYLPIVPQLLAVALVLALGIGLLIWETKLRGRFHRRVVIAFMMMLIGVFLLRTGSSPSNHLYGFICFFIAPIYLIRAFYLDFSAAPELDKIFARYAIFLGLAVSVGTYLYLRPHLGPYKIQILIYTFLLAFMMMMAAFRRKRVNELSFMLILSASILLSVNAFLLAINHFIQQDPTIAIVVNVILMLGIYLLTLGAATRKLIVES